MTATPHESTGSGIPGLWFAVGLGFSAIIVGAMLMHERLAIAFATESNAVFCGIGLLIIALRYGFREPPHSVAARRPGPCPNMSACSS